VPRCPLFGRYGVESGHHRLVMSLSAFDPFRSSPSKFYWNAQGDIHLASAEQFRMLTPVLHGSRCLEAVLESGVVFGFGLLWSGHAGVTIGIKNTRQHRCIDDGANDQRVGVAANGNLRDRQSVRG
jgi:hypothetical protein